MTKLTKYSLSPFAILLSLIALYYYQLWYYPFSFNYETDINDQYLLFSWITFILFVTILVVVLSSPEKHIIKIQKPPIQFLFIVLIISFALIVLYPKGYGLANEHFINIVIALIISLICCIFFNTFHFRTLLCIFSLFYIAQIGIIFTQFSNIYNTGQSSLALTGTLQNSGILSCYIVIHFPMICFLIRKPKIKKNIKLALLCLLLLLTWAVLFITLSRTAIMAFILICPITLRIHFSIPIGTLLKRIPKSAIIISIAIIISGLCALCYHLYHVKPLSAMGRLLMWNVAFQHLGDNLWIGTGLGHFTTYYPRWQAQYFHSNPNPPLSFFLSAGPSYIIFNEPLQWLEETGIFSFLISLLLLWDFFRARSIRQKHLLYTAKVVVLAVLACSFTSYPLHINPFLFIAAVCYATANIVRDDPIPLKLKVKLYYLRIYPILLLIFSITTIYKSIQQAVLIEKWQKLKNDYTQSYPEIKKKYEKLYPALRHNGKFLINYGKFLMSDYENYENAVEIFEESKKYFITDRSIKGTAVLYKSLKKYRNAIKNYYLLSGYVPNRFGPKYELALLYKKKGDTAKARRIADILLTMPIKFPSYQVFSMKKNIRELFYHSKQ